jgi:hypothetical protein
MKRIVLFSLAVFVFGFTAIANAGTITLVNQYAPSYSGDPDAFLTWCPNPLVENFEDNNLVPGLTITEVNGAGSIQYGGYTNIVDKDTGRYQIFNFDSLYGFGGWFDLAGPGGSGSSIDVYIDDTNTYVMTIPNTAAGEFYGFFSTDPFTSVRFEEGNSSGIQETYFTVDLAMCPVPLPPALLLMGSGLLGVAGLRRCRKSA